MHTQTSFESDRLYFRPLTQDDNDLLFPFITEEITHYWIGWEYPKNKEECQQWIENLLSKKSKIFLAFSKTTKAFVGSVSLDFIERTKEYEVGIWIGSNMQAQGFATEILKRFLAWIKENTDLSYVIYSYTQGNTGSRKLLEKIPYIFARKEWEQKNGKRVYTINFFVPLN